MTIANHELASQSPEVSGTSLPANETTRYQQIKQSIHLRQSTLRGAMQEDLSNNGKYMFIASWAGCVALKGVGKAKLPDAGIGATSMAVYGITQSVPAAAFAAAFTTASWTKTNAEIVNHSVNNNPETYKAAGKSLQKVNNVWANTMPGLDLHTADKQQKLHDKSSTKRVGTVAMTRGLRGIVATTKVAPYMAAAGRANHSPEERKKLANALAIDAGAARLITYAGITAGIGWTAEHNPEIAEHMERAVTNPLTWMAVSATIGLSAIITNKFKSIDANRLFRTQPN